MSRPIIISLEGNIGAGKTTLLEKLSEQINTESYGNWVFLREPVHIWDEIRDKEGQTMLSKFYEDSKKYSFAFQIMAYTTRLQELRRILKENPHCKGVICERSLDADKHIFAKMLHDDGTMEDILFDIYRRLFGEHETEFSLDGIVYLDVEPTVCHSRINKRSREGESGISMDYLEKCCQYHKDWMGALSSDYPCLTLDVNADTDSGSGSRSDTNIDLILQFITQF